VARATRIRCFVAVDIDAPDVVSRIRALQEDLLRTEARVKLVEPQNLHITLAFIGEVPPVLVERAKDALSRIHYKSFTIKLEGMGAFPSLMRPRVIWIGVHEGAALLTDLASLVRRELKRAGVPFDPKDFVPHLTLARVKGSNPTLTAWLRRLEAVEAGEITVDKVKLKKSRLTHHGPIYETLYEKPLE